MRDAKAERNEIGGAGAKKRGDSVKGNPKAACRIKGSVDQRTLSFCYNLS